MLSIAVLYHLVRRHFGVKAGLVAALVLAVFPITVATERNNTIDGQLVLVLLLAAWAFLKAAESGKVRHLLLGAFLVGVGFNIKMLQAFMPLPAFYLVYLLSAHHRWWQRVLHLAAATAVLFVVSFVWVAAVDLTPADKRPYVGSSTNNTVTELIIGHNGLRRLGLLNGGPGPGDDRRPVAGTDANGPLQNGGAGQPAGGASPSRLNSAPGGNAPRPFPGGPPPNAAGGPPAGGRPGGSNEVGTAGVLRLFQEPLVTEASWVLVWTLIGLPLQRRLPLGDMGVAAAAMGDFDFARQCLTDSLAIARQIADRTQEILCLGHLGWLYVQLEQPTGALQHLEAALALAERIDSRTEQSWLLTGIARAHALAGNCAQATGYAHRALELAQKTGRVRDEGIVRNVLL